MYESLCLAHRRASPETVPLAERGWRPAAAARNRGPGRHGHRPPGITTRTARSVAARAAEAMPQTEARNRSRKPPRLERREARVSPLRDAGRFAKRPGVLPHA